LVIIGNNTRDRVGVGSAGGRREVGVGTSGGFFARPRPDLNESGDYSKSNARTHAKLEIKSI